MVEVRQATIHDWEAISKFVIETYGNAAKFKMRERWIWQMQKAPGICSNSKLVPSWIAIDGARVVGQISLQLTKLCIGGSEYPAGWIVDVMVHPLYRGRGLGHRLYKAILDCNHTVVTLTMAPATRSIAERAGCSTLPPVTQYVRLGQLTSACLIQYLRSSSAVGGKGRVWLPVACKMNRTLLDKSLGLIAKLTEILSADPVRTDKVIETEVLDADDIDRLFRSMRSEALAFFDRSSSHFFWRFDNAPDLDYRYAYFHKDGRVLGIVVWRLPRPEELQVGTLVDVLASPDHRQVIDALVAHATASMNHCEGITAAASNPAWQNSLRKYGYLAVKKHYPVISSRDQTLLERLAGLKHWHFSKSDHDWDQVHPIN